MNPAKALKELSMPQTRDEKIPAIITRSAHLAGLTYSRCYEIWYGRARRIEPAEIARISEALKQKQARETRDELQELRLRLTCLENLLVLSDPEFHRDTIDQIGQQVRRYR